MLTFDGSAVSGSLSGALSSDMFDDGALSSSDTLAGGAFSSDTLDGALSNSLSSALSALESALGRKCPVVYPRSEVRPADNQGTGGIPSSPSSAEEEAWHSALPTNRRTVNTAVTRTAKAKEWPRIR